MSPDPIQFETANLRWSISLDRQDHHTTATVMGSPSAMTPVSPEALIPARPVEFSITESNQDKLFERIRAEIVRQDGPIKRGDSSD